MYQQLPKSGHELSGWQGGTPLAEVEALPRHPPRPPCSFAHRGKGRDTPQAGVTFVCAKAGLRYGERGII